MKNKGFTLVELLASIILLAALMMLIFPTVLERVQKEDEEIIEKKKKLIYTEAYNFIYENKDIYPVMDGKIYCINMGYLSSIGRMPIDDYDNLLKVEGISNNYIYMQLGTNNNVYRIVSSTTTCTDGVIES